MRFKIAVASQLTLLLILPAEGPRFLCICLHVARITDRKVHSSLAEVVERTLLPLEAPVRFVSCTCGKGMGIALGEWAVRN